VLIAQGGDERTRHRGPRSQTGPARDRQGPSGGSDRGTEAVETAAGREVWTGFEHHPSPH